MHGQVAVTKEYIEDLKKVDLNFDGKADEYVVIKKEVAQICGEMSQEDVKKAVEANYGKYKKLIEDKKLFMGRNWLAAYKVENGVTTISSKMAVPIFVAGASTLFKVKHLKQNVLLHDPIKVKGSKNKVFFVMNIDYSNAVTYDGKEVKIDYNSIKMDVVSADGFATLEKGEKPGSDDVKSIAFSKVSEILRREDYPEYYVQK